MLSGLILTAFLMGLGGAPHCAAMCGLACAAALPRGVPVLTFVGRMCGYAALGSVAATSSGLVAAWGRQFSFLQPLWVMALVACCFVGLWMLRTGATPTSLDRLGQSLYVRLKKRLARHFSANASSSALTKRMLEWLAGAAWAMLPCGLLYAAVMVAALAPSAYGGAGVMLAFALPTTVGVWAAPALLAWLRKRSPSATRQPAGVASQTAVPVVWLQHRATATLGSSFSQVGDAGAWVDPRWAIRVSGLMMAGMAAWGAYHQAVAQWRAWCA